MKIAVWKTGHEIADTIAEAINAGLPKSISKSTSECNERTIAEAEIHCCYGILRGADTVFGMAKKAGKPWFNIDRGYWKPAHYDGYYRVSLCGTQQTFGIDKLEPDYERWDRLGLEILPAKSNGTVWLHCPPTKPVEQFYGINPKELPKDSRLRIRDKNTVRPLQSDLYNSYVVTTFNSSVGWEALRQGIPVISDPNHSIVGAYQKMLDRPIRLDVDERRRLFALMASLQLTLTEIRDGHLWQLLQKLLPLYQSTSVMTAAKA